MSRGEVSIAFTIDGDPGDIVQAVEDFRNAIADHFTDSNYGVTLQGKPSVSVRNMP